VRPFVINNVGNDLRKIRLCLQVQQQGKVSEWCNYEGKNKQKNYFTNSQINLSEEKSEQSMSKICFSRT